MDQLAPVLTQLNEQCVRLAMAVGAVRYLGDITTIEDIASVVHAMDVLDALDRDLGNSLAALRRLSTRVEDIAERPQEVRLESEYFSVSPAPGRTAVEMDLGDVCITVPAGPVLDQLVRSITEASKHARQPQPDQDTSPSADR